MTTITSMSTVCLTSRFGYLVIALTIVNFVGCGRLSRSSPESDPSPPQLVVLYVPCVVSKQFLSPYDAKVPYTPNLDKFAREATVFTKHRTEAGLCGIAYASILTGNQAPNHGVFAHPTKLSDSVYDITEAFADNGYEVYFWNDQPLAAADLNYGQGVPKKHVYSRMLKSGDRDFALMLQGLRSDKERRAFVLVNYCTNQTPYKSSELASFQSAYPREFRNLGLGTRNEFGNYARMYYKHQYMMRYDFEQLRMQQALSEYDVDRLRNIIALLYKSSVSAIDEIFGQVIESIDGAGLGDDSLIVFTADHGESMFRPQAPFKWSHGFAVQADAMDVPLIVRTPLHMRTPGRCDFVTRSIDVFPTLASLANLKLPADTAMDGQDISESMGDDPRDLDLMAFSHSGMVLPPLEKPSNVQELMTEKLANYYPSADMDYTWVAVRRGDLVVKYRQNDGKEPIFEAFDLISDPGESTDIFDESDANHQQMSQALLEYKKNLVSSSREWASVRAQGLLKDDESLERLRTMGYIK